MIKEFEFYHGAVITKLIHNHRGEISICPYNGDSNSSYILNRGKGLYIKYSSKRMPPWHFSFNKIHLKEIVEMSENLDDVFVVLVCGEDGVVALSLDELSKLISFPTIDTAWIRISRTPRSEYSVKGSRDVLKYKIGRTDFSKRIID